MWTKFGDDMSKCSWVMLDKTDRLTDRQTDRQTDKPTNEHTCQNCKFWQVMKKLIHWSMFFDFTVHSLPSGNTFVVLLFVCTFVFTLTLKLNIKCRLLMYAVQTYGIGIVFIPFRAIHSYTCTTYPGIGWHFKNVYEVLKFQYRTKIVSFSLSIYGWNILCEVRF